MLRPALPAEPTRHARTGYVKELDLLTVLDVLRNGGAMSRADVSRITRFGAPAVVKIARKLLDARLVLEEGAGVPTGGKRPALLRFNAAGGRVLGIDLGGTHLRMAVADLDGTFIDQSSEDIDPAAGPAAILARIAQRGRWLLNKTRAGRLLAVGLATPGVVDVERGVVLVARNLRGWRDVPVQRSLSQTFGVPVAIENDVNAAAIGERWHGAGRGHDHLVFVSIGTGIGSGIILDGRIHRGPHYTAGEIAFLPSGFPDDQGKREAMLEDVASGPAIVRRAVARGLTTPDGAALTTRRVFELAQSSDPIAAQAVREAVSATARGVAALLSTIDPTVVVFGGGLSRQGDALLGPLREEVKKLVRLRVELMPSMLGVDAQLHGAVFSALRLADASLVELDSVPSAVG